MSCRMPIRVLFALALFSLLVAGAALADDEQSFNLRIELQLDAEVKAALQDGDRFVITVSGADQYGRSSSEEGMRMERSWARSAPLGEWVFKKALVPGQIYKVELEIVRGDDEPVSVRYLSALDKLPRKPVDSQLKMRLLRGHSRDQRHTLVLVNKDSDGVYRMSVFTA